MAQPTPPHNIEAEESLLGSLIIHPDKFNDLDNDFRSEDFYNPKNQEVFRAIESLYFDGSAIDFTTITDSLNKLGSFEKIGGIDYINDLMLKAPFEPNVKEYSNIIKDLSLARQLIKATDDISKKAYANTDDIHDQIVEAESQIFNLSQGRTSQTELVPIKKVVFDSLTKIQQIQKEGGKRTGIESGFVDLDYLTTGFQDSDLIIVAARPSVGKTALALNIATYAAVKEGQNVLIFSLEMDRGQLAQRMIQAEACIDGNDVRNGTLTTRQWQALTASAELIANSSIEINDKPGISLAEIMSICRRRKNQEPIDLIIIDYMQLIRSNNRYENRQVEVSEISRMLKQLAREMDCPVICLSQLSRSSVNRGTAGPQLNDLRDSGAIEQDADLVMFLYRKMDESGEEMDNVVTLNLSKNRNGPTGSVDLMWNSIYTKFTNFSEDEEDSSY